MATNQLVRTVFSNRNTRFRLVGVVGLALLVVSAGCLSSGSKSDMTAQKIGQQASHKYQTVTSYQGTMTVTTNAGGQQTTITQRIWAKPHQNELRTRTLAPPSKAGNLDVTNGTLVWTYNATTKTARKTRLQYVHRTAAGQNYAALFSNLSKQYNVTYHGKSSIAGHTTYEVTLRPKTHTQVTKSLDHETIWLDTQYWFPVKTHTVFSIQNRTATTTTTYTNLTFNENISASRFTLHPPKGATVQTQNQTQQTTHSKIVQYQSISAAESNISFAISRPSWVPKGYELNQVIVARKQNTTATILSYQNSSTGQISVKQSPIPTANQQGAGGGTAVTVDGHDGRYTSFGSASSLTWQCGNSRYRITGTIHRRTIQKLGNSTACTE